MYKKAVLGVSVNPVHDGGVFADYRAYASENPTAAAMIEALRGVDDLTIDGSIPILSSYVNMGFNGHWERRLRG